MSNEIVYQRRGLDRYLVLLVLLLSAFGLLMVYSVSQPLTEQPLLYFKKQAMHLMLGMALMLLLSGADLRRLDNSKVIGAIMAVVFVLLILTFIPPFAAPAKGAHRWINIPVHLQPSELAKAAMILFFAHYLAAQGEGIRRFWRGVVPLVGIAMPFIGLIAIEPDLGAAAVIAALMILMLFIGGAQWRVIGLGFVGGALFIASQIVMAPWRVKRLLGFLDPSRDPLGVNWQTWQAQIAIGRGGLTGVGIGNGWQKFYFVPEMHTDFILANLGEEMGLLGLLLAFLLFFFLIWRSIRLCLRATDLFVRLCGLGAALLIGMQVLINAAVVMSLLPNKGLSLPFFSYGGSNTLLNFALIGVILAAARLAPVDATSKPKVLHLLQRRELPAESEEGITC